MFIKRKFTALAVAALTVAGVTAGAGSASAIGRVSCTQNDFFWIYSDNPTCWANSGYALVTLYNTIGGKSGNNSGRVDGPNFYRTFRYNVTLPWNSTTITKVTIN